jgi:hypothetical protein
MTASAWTPTWFWLTLAESCGLHGNGNDLRSIRNKKEKPNVINEVEALCSFTWDNNPGSSGRAGSGIRINSHGSGTEL